MGVVGRIYHKIIKIKTAQAIVAVVVTTVTSPKIQIQIRIMPQ